ncbi:MAG: hypothetical protein U9R75_03390 [Candidatus Thermoplasmatota archaeon]|nr:hypothetical protein [Candidatus Thermoplasmatota archaeon]
MKKDTRKGIKRNDGEFITWDELLSNDNIDILVTSDQFKKIIKKIGNEVDSDGYVIDPKTGEPVHSIDSDDLQLDEIGAILPGSKIFIKENIASFSQYLFDYKHKSCQS